jgi:protein-S-isoprenylcysteine O-methyltransferase Ste14
MPYDQAAGIFLLISWGVVWYFFFAVYSSPKGGEGVFNRLFAYSAYVTLVLVALWAALAWSGVGVWHIASNSRTFLILCATGLVMTLLGQICLILSRKSLRFLSSSEVFFSLSKRKTEGVLYRYLKHPMYVGLLLALAGSSLLLLNAVALAFVLIVLGPILIVRARLDHI